MANTKTTSKTKSKTTNKEKKPILNDYLKKELNTLKDNIFLLVIGFLLFPLGLLFSYNTRKKEFVLSITHLSLSIISFIIFIIIVITSQKYLY